MRRSLLDMQVAAGAAVVAVASLSLGSVFAWGGLALAATGAVIYATRLRPGAGKGSETAGALSAAPNEVLWADAEQALRFLDRYPADDELSQPVMRLAQLGRRAVERGRRSPADAAAARTRHVLCLATETLAAYAGSENGRRQGRVERMREMLGQAAESIARDAASDSHDQALCVRLRVLEQELKNTQTGGSSHGHDDQH